MIRRLALAAAAATTLAFAVPGVAAAQDAAPSAGSYVGLSPQAVRDWMAGLGATVGQPVQDGEDVYFTVDIEGVKWLVFFYSCQIDALCGDVQYSIGFDGAGVTAEEVNAWNRERRFLKAFLSDGGAEGPLVLAQQDVLIVSGQPVDQLADPTIVFLEGIVLFDEWLRSVAD